MKTLPQMVVDAGYYYGVDVDRLLVDVRRYPGCADLKKRSLQNMIHGAIKMTPAVALALSAVLGVSADDVLRAVTK